MQYNSAVVLSCGHVQQKNSLSNHCCREYSGRPVSYTHLLDDRTVYVNEESSHFAVAGAEIATWHVAFAGHSKLPRHTKRMGLVSAEFCSACKLLRIRRGKLMVEVRAL